MKPHTTVILNWTGHQWFETYDDLIARLKKKKTYSIFSYLNYKMVEKYLSLSLLSLKMFK